MKRPLLVALGLSCLSCIGAVALMIWQHQVSADGLSERWIVVDVLNGNTLAIGRQGEFQQARLCGIQVAPVHDEEAKALLQNLSAQVDDSVQVVAVGRDRDKTLVAEIYTIQNSKETLFQEALLLGGLAALDSDELKTCPNAFSMRAAADIARTSQSSSMPSR
jgi:hypothetical protein